MAGRPNTIIVADDDCDHRIIIGSLILDKGYNSLEACSAEGLIEAACGLDGQLLAVITDLDLQQRWRGIFAAEAIRRSKPRIPICIMSAHTEEEIREAVGEGDFYVMPKADYKTLLPRFLDSLSTAQP